MSDFLCNITHDQVLFAQINNLVLSTMEFQTIAYSCCLFLKTFKFYFSKLVSFSVSTGSSYCFPS
jgi:hypothetical protein